jgi:hypothetical protein
MSKDNMARYGLDGSAWRGRHEGHSDVLQGPDYLYRPGHILVAADQEYTAGVVAHLQGLRATPHEEFTARFNQEGLALHAFEVPAEHHIPTLVNRLREHEYGKPTPTVAPNHVYTGEYVYEGGPEGGPHATKDGDEFRVPHPEAGPARIAILDTGYDHAVKIYHPRLAERLESVGDEDPLLRGDLLAREAGHGTFVAGIIMKHSPELNIRQVRVLDRAGVGDDVTVALGLLRVSSASVVNLSLGGYTHGNLPPVVLGAALELLHESVTVVAAAGNGGSDRPFWPAAFPRVMAVGALDTTNGTPVRADFSNHGYWVDLYAPGIDVHSTYLHGDYEEPETHFEHLTGWARWSGTSFAAPQVAAEVARLSGNGMTAREAAVQLVEKAEELGGIGKVLIPGTNQTWA